ncbi:MAG: DUF5985 family protein [Pseudomonadota bacterium]
MAYIIYSLCALAALLCALVLFLAFRRSRYRLLLWGGLCFAGLTINNILLVIDKNTPPEMDLSTVRLVTALISISILLYGLIFDAE